MINIKYSTEKSKFLKKIIFQMIKETFLIDFQ